MRLSLKQRLELLITGKTFLRMKKKPGWSGPLPIYLVRCSKHGNYERHPMGEDGYFACLKYIEEEFDAKMISGD